MRGNAYGDFCSTGRNPITLEAFHGYGHVGELQSRCLLGDSLTRRRWRYLPHAASALSSKSALAFFGLAAYQHVESAVRVVHEFLVDPDLGRA